MKIPKISYAVISGRLTRDAEVKHLEDGKQLTKLSVAYDTGRMVGGEWQSEPNYIDVTAWGKSAEWCAGGKKGQAVLVSGDLKIRNYDGKKFPEITGFNLSVQFLDEKAKQPEDMSQHNQVIEKVEQDDVPF